MGVNRHTHANIHICRTFNKCLDKLYIIYVYVSNIHCILYLCVHMCEYVHTHIRRTYNKLSVQEHLPVIPSRLGVSLLGMYLITD